MNYFWQHASIFIFINSIQCFEITSIWPDQTFFLSVLVFSEALWYFDLWCNFWHVFFNWIVCKQHLCYIYNPSWLALKDKLNFTDRSFWRSNVLKWWNSKQFSPFFEATCSKHCFMSSPTTWLVPGCVVCVLSRYTLGMLASCTVNALTTAMTCTTTNKWSVGGACAVFLFRKNHAL